MNTILRDELVQQIERRIINESIDRIKQCLRLVTEDQVWEKPNESSNSIGTLVLHVIGNCQQWIVSSFGGTPDRRRRREEFSPKEFFRKGELEFFLDKLESELRVTMFQITEDKLMDMYEIQRFHESGVSVLVHAIEHFSYHTGQIAIQTKMLRDVDLKFYGDLDLD